MVHSCWIIGCKNRFVKDKGISFHRFPREAEKRNLWIRAVKRSPVPSLDDKRICSIHFQTGKPSKDPNHPDYIPNIFPWGRSKASAAKYEARKLRSLKRACLNTAEKKASVRTPAPPDSETNVASTSDATKPDSLVSIAFGPSWERKERDRLHRLKTQILQENEEVAKLNIENLKNFSSFLPVKEILQSLPKPNIGHQDTCSSKSTGQCSCSMDSCMASESVNAPCPQPSQEPMTTKPTVIHMHSSGERHKCKICSKSFVQAAQLIVHRRIHHNQQHYRCVICNKSFTQAHRLRAHVWTHTCEKPYKCDICGKTFARKPYLNNHKKIHMRLKPYVCEVCKKAFTYVDQLERHRSIHYAKIYICEVCNKAFTYVDQLERHRSIHYVKIYLCNICNAPFSDVGVMNRHIFTQHTNIKPYKCEFCEQRFALFYHLKCHRMTHTKEKNYVCDICETAFGQSSTLERHKLTHTKEKPYACEVCSKEFASWSSLSQHKKSYIHHAKLNSSEHEKALIRPMLIILDRSNHENGEK